VKFLHPHTSNECVRGLSASYQLISHFTSFIS